MGIERTLGEAFKDAGTILKSNKAINSLDNFFLGGFRDIGTHMKDEKDVVKAIKGAYTNKDGSLAYGKIAGSYLTAAAAGRVVTGGGLYRDANGNANLIGVPFV